METAYSFKERSKVSEMMKDWNEKAPPNIRNMSGSEVKIIFK